VPGPTLVVVSDAHLGVTPPAVEATLLAFLETVPTLGDSLLINGDLFDFWYSYSRVIPRRGFHVAAALERLCAEGATLLAEPALVGARWIATCDNRRAQERVSVEQFGLKTVVCGPTREAVEAKLRELLQYGARLEQDLECIDGMWTAVCESLG